MENLISPDKGQLSHESTIFNTALATKQAVNVRVFPSRSKRAVKVPREELENKLADLAKGLR